MKKGIIVLFVVLLNLSAVFGQGWETDFEKAKEIATNENKPIVLVFQGSDWCAPCIKLDREIWSTETFKSYAKDHFVMLQVNFPRRRKNTLSESQTIANAKLAEVYNKNGVFPFVVVADNKGNVLGETSYKKTTPEAYIKELNSFIKTKNLPTQQKSYKRTLKLMGSQFDITVVAKNAITANEYIDEAIAEITRIEKLISSWDKTTQTSEINKSAGIKPVKVDIELFNLINRAIGLSKLTDGAFDISYASMDRIWKFDNSMKKMPSEEKIKNSVVKVGYKNIVLDKNNSTVFLKKEGMKIGFGAIGKGYAADKAKQLLISKGVSSGIINASGDMTTWGKQPNGNEWKVAITNPLNKNKAFALLPITNGAVVTSGDYEKYVTFNGKRYTHIIDPQTGYPSSGIISVTVFAPKAELADALATSVFVMGKEVGLDRINQLPQVECIIIDDEGNITKSKNIEIDKL
jgi:thiamine biosynthesis lipoprotein